MKLIPEAVWNVLLAELEARRAEARRNEERIDRLTEALSRKSDIPLYMPQGHLPSYETGNVELEKSSGWFDTKPIPLPKTGGVQK